MNLLKLANYIFSFYILNMTFKNNYPDIYNNFLINISYLCKIFTVKYNNIFLPRFCMSCLSSPVKH